MIISHQKQFIFIHIYKVAGTSIKNSLLKYSEGGSGNLPFRSRIVNRIFGNKIFTKDFDPHITAMELKRELPNKIYNNYFKFAFVRNPFDWQVSLYNYMLKNKDHKQHDIFNKIRNFDEYLDWRINYDLKFQKDFITDDRDQIIVDFIGKIENLENDFKSVSSKLRIPYKPLPRLNRSNYLSYLTYYNDRSFEKVYKAFEPDFKFFNYGKLLNMG